MTETKALPKGGRMWMMAESDGAGAEGKQLGEKAERTKEDERGKKNARNDME